MEDTNMTSAVVAETNALSTQVPDEKTDVVSTHVLVEQDKVDRLRDLSRRTRIAQSEYLREAVDDLLSKYPKKEEV